MATKPNFLSSINSFLTSIVTVTKHRNSMAVIADNLYLARVLDTQLTTNVATSSGASFTYRISTHKQGNKVTIRGTITNATGSALNIGDIFQITNTEYRPIETVSVLATSTTGQTTSFSLATNGTLSLSNIMASATNYNFLTFYTTE